MSVPLIIQGITFNYPVSNDNSWATDATGWAIAVTDGLGAAVQPGDLSPTTLVVINNTGSLANVTDLIVNNAITRAALVDYYVYRVFGATEIAEVGTLRLVYKTNATTWEVDRTFTGDGQISFSVTTGGQVQYTSVPISGSGSYTGTMRFRARALPIQGS